jgi:hypothetical protein
VRYGEQWSGFGIRNRDELRRISMTLRPFVRQLSIVTAYIAFAFVGAIVLGVF